MQADVAVKKTKRAGAQSVGDVFADIGRAPRKRIPDEEMDPEVAYQIVHDQLMLDGNARLNLATFVGTWLEPQARRLMDETFDKNMINKDEYPQTAEMEVRCIDMISCLWHAPDPDDAPGLFHDRLVGGGHARQPRAQAPMAVLRVVVKRGFTHDVASLFIENLARAAPPREAADAGEGRRHLDGLQALTRERRSGGGRSAPGDPPLQAITLKRDPAPPSHRRGALTRAGTAPNGGPGRRWSRRLRRAMIGVPASGPHGRWTWPGERSLAT